MRLQKSLWRWLLAAGCLAAAGFASAAEVTAVSGRVYLDANGNGRPDLGEKGLPGIRVTDGVGFAVTGADGAYALPIADDSIISCRAARTVSVCWPSGKWPAGRWWQRLSEITDADAVHFGLRDDVQQVPFVFLHTSDDHGAGRMYSDHFAHDARRMLPAAKFLFNTGDMGYATPAGGDQMFRSIAGHAAAFPVPMFMTPGNHDFVTPDNKTPLDPSLAGWGFFTKYLGPVRWSFDYAGVHFLGLDYVEKEGTNYVDRIPHAAVAFLEKDLASLPKGTRVVLLVHCYDASADFFRALHRYPVTQIYCGHTHTPSFARVGRVPTITNYGVGTGVVTAEAIDVAERRSYTQGDHHTLSYFKKVTAPAMEKRRQQRHVVDPLTLQNATRVLADSPQAESVEIIAEVTPGTARKVGLRIGARDAIDITFDGTAVRVAGAPVPFVLLPDETAIPPAPDAPTNAPARKIPADRTLRWHLLVDRDRLSLLANDRFRITKAIRVDQPAHVTLLAEGGTATFDRAELWELRPVRNKASRALHHFPPPAWTWGAPQLVAACQDDGSKVGEEMRQRFSADGVKDYDLEP